MNNGVPTHTHPNPALPQLLDLRALEAHFGIGRTTAYLLATSGDIQSLTMGAPGKRGKRVFLLQSVLEFIQRRAAESKRLKCGKAEVATAAK